MLYALFLILAIAYNWWKLSKERVALVNSLMEATSSSHREMILSHHFYVFIFECFLSVLVAHLIGEKSHDLGILAFGAIYVALLLAGFQLYKLVVKNLERRSGLALREGFRQHVVRELRVSFAVIMLPILIYSLINWAFLDSVVEDWGSLWFIGLIFNILFVSVLTISCTVIIMLKLIPNREVSEPEYMEIIQRRLDQIGMPDIRVRWIETDIKNAFVVGLKLLRFSNQTMFIGKSLRTSLTMDEFDAVIAHELAHVANHHIQKRVIDLVKNFLSILVGAMVIILGTLLVNTLYWGMDSILHSEDGLYLAVLAALSWGFLNYILLFDTIRSHEFEADAYAVMVLGARADSLESALMKLTNGDEIPEYLKNRQRRKGPERPWVAFLQRLFSTHPDVSTRMSFLKHKTSNGLPFNYYVSPAEALRKKIAVFMGWKVAMPMTAAMAALMTWTVISFKQGQELLALIERGTETEIIANESLVKRINSSPKLIGPSFMFHVVKTKNEKLIDHFMHHGGNKGHALVYMLQMKEKELFQKFFDKHAKELKPGEYFILLRTTAQLNLTDEYRQLVNSSQFTALTPDLKENVSRVYEQTQKAKRAPASVK